MVIVIGSVLGGFQSALPRGERPALLSCSWLRQNFNPRSREGSDEYPCKRYEHIDISIRAPARGATDNVVFYGCFVTISIRAPARGATRCMNIDIQNQRNFNPRSREGSDVRYFLFRFRKVISIRAPARGATPQDLQITTAKTISIRAPARGATFGERSNGSSSIISIRAPARGATCFHR